MTPWWKKPWVWLAAVINVAVGMVGILLFALSKKERSTVPRPKDLDPPPAPETPDVPVPDREVLNTGPSDKYEDEKKTADNIHDAVASVNSRFD